MKNGRISAAVFALALTAGLPLAQGCGKRVEEKGRASATPSFLEVEVPRRPPPSAQTIARGRAVYLANCVQCHGQNGAGDGFGAPFLVPPPRDFTSAQYKFRTTGTGEPAAPRR